MKESTRQQFRWAPHTIGITSVKPKDYEPACTVEASTPYAVWIQLKDTPEPLQVGDILESESGELRIYKYVGFEEAQWFVPEVKPVSEGSPAGSPAESAVSPRVM
jgi:hypothetical protein